MSLISLEKYVEKERNGSPGWQDLFQRSEVAKKNSEPPYTVREILQQPWVWVESAKLAVEKSNEVNELLQQSPKVVLTGAGSSYFVGCTVDLLLRGRLQKECVSIPTTDLIIAPRIYLFPANTGLLISFSRSGASRESFEAIQAVRRHFPDFLHLLITCNSEGELITRFSKDPDFHALPLHPTTCDKGLAMTSSFTSMAITAQMPVFGREVSEYLSHVQNLAELGRYVLARSAEIYEANRASRPTRVCILGSGVLAGAAREGALKILELSDGRIATLAESFLGVRHGPLSFIDRNTLVLYFLASDERIRKYERDLVAEIRSNQLAGNTVAVGFGLEEDIAELTDYSIELSQSGVDYLADEFRPPIDVLLAQVTALGLSLDRGLDPDNPSPRGAIHRVAQGVTIY
jgi:tagatose-6-phosphate ketose/aldose isomerase